jgi:hypothetical protein
MLGVILAGVVLGAATLVILKGRKRPEARPVRVETKDRKDPRRR